MLQLHADELQQIRNAVHDKQTNFLVVDESTLPGIQYLNILLGSLETSTSVICPTVNLYHVRQIATALLKQLTMRLDLLESTKTLCCLLSSATKYMVDVVAILKSLYSKLFHVTYVTQLLHNCAVNVKSHFENVDQLIGKV